MITSKYKVEVNPKANPDQIIEEKSITTLYFKIIANGVGISCGTQRGQLHAVVRWYSSQPCLTGRTDGYTNRHANRYAEAHIVHRRAECRS